MLEEQIIYFVYFHLGDPYGVMSTEFFQQIPDGGRDAQFLQHTGAQVLGEPPHVFNDAVYIVQQRVEICLKKFYPPYFCQFLGKQTHLEFKIHQGLSQLIVQFHGDALTLMFRGGHQLGRESPEFLFRFL